MENFILPPLPRIYFGKGQLDSVGRVVSEYGDRVLLVYGGGSIKKNGIYERVLQGLKAQRLEFFELSGVEPNPRIATVKKGVELAKANNVNVILAVGGGSVIDCSKAISLGAFYGEEDVWQMIRTGADPGSSLPVVTALTISATGSEANRGLVISNPELNEKRGMRCERAIPKAAIMDPELTFTVSKYQTACGVVDIMAHVFESYFCMSDDAFLLDRFSEAVLKTAVKFGPKAYDNPNDYEARSELMWASSWALNGLLWSGKNTGSTCHPIEHALSAYYDITHGAGLAIVIPAWMEYVLSEKTVDRFVKYGANIWGLTPSGDPLRDAKAAIQKTREFFGFFDIPHTLREAGITEKNEFENMAAFAAESIFENAFVPLDSTDVQKIFELCY